MGFGILALYFVSAAGIALTVRVFISIPDELFRKILHFILLGSIFVFVYCFKTWWISALASLLFAILVYPILVLCERFKGYSEITTERKKGELKASLLLVFAMFAVVIGICWGWFGDQFLVLISILAWGVGDALAALIGKKFGKHKIKRKYIDEKKSYEGTAAMFASSLISVTVILAIRGGLHLAGYFVIPVIIALVSAVTELYSKNGYDTVICPLSAMAAIMPLMHLFGGF